MVNNTNKGNKMNKTGLELLIDWAEERGFVSQSPSKEGLCTNVVEELGEFIEAYKQNDEHEKVDALSDIMVFCSTELTKMGYNPEKVIKETYREIQSRQGSWNSEGTKWVKDETPEAKAKWIKSDYSKCKL